jgi:hypothetical protein
MPRHAWSCEDLAVPTRLASLSVCCALGEHENSRTCQSMSAWWSQAIAGLPSGTHHDRKGLGNLSDGPRACCCGGACLLASSVYTRQQAGQRGCCIGAPSVHSLERAGPQLPSAVVKRPADATCWLIAPPSRVCQPALASRLAAWRSAMSRSCPALPDACSRQCKHRSCYTGACWCHQDNPGPQRDEAAPTGSSCTTWQRARTKRRH